MKSVEEIKKESCGLRGDIREALVVGGSHFSEETTQLIKFHGSYQQDDRDVRSERRKEGLDKAWQFMVRSKIPGGDLTAAQYLVHDRMADEVAGGSIRLTNRQGIQMHGVLFGTLKECIRRINTCGLTTWGACGDIVRNTVASALPIKDGVHQEVQELARTISHTFYAASRGYSEIWLDGEQVACEPEDPIYGETYLPRKFKFGIAVPPRNDIDVFTQDCGLVPSVENGHITGTTIYVGGSFGMSFGQLKTRPALSQPLFYVAKEHILTALKAVVEVQRAHGRRDDRKQARLKYLILSHGIEWFRERTLELLDIPVEAARPVHFDTVEDQLGWHDQGDGRLFCGVPIPNGRIRDTEGVRYRTAFREVCQTLAPGVRITSNCNLYFYDIAPADRPTLTGILKGHGLIAPEEMTRAGRMAHACVALPTCGLALSESERVFPELMAKIDGILTELGLRDEPILFRMSGCPNGCPRPYNADFAFVGRAPGKYALYVGGSHRGDRLAGLLEKSVVFDDLAGRVRVLLEEYVKNRLTGESFSDTWRRTQIAGEEPNSEQFHIEVAERKKRQEAGSESPDPIRHDVELRRFELQADGASLAFLSYTLHGEHMVLDHTFVPDELRGKGLAAHLVRKALDFAGQRGLKVNPQCSYAAEFIQKHPEFADLLDPNP